MKKQKLIINGTNLITNQPFVKIIKTSNEFVLAEKYSKLSSNLYILGWTLYNEFESGNSHPCNAGAYLCETLEELTGLNLS